MSDVFLPREDLVRGYVKDILKGRGVLLSGPEGIGKTFLLNEVVADLEVRGVDVVYVPAGRAFKQVVLGIAEALHGLGALVVDGLDVSGSWDVVASRLARPAVDKTAPAVIGSLARSDLVVVLDHFDAPWPRYASYFKQILDISTVLAASEQAHTSRMSGFRSYFRVVEVPRLTTEEAGALADQAYEFYGVNCADADGFKRRVAVLADGLPFQLKKLVEDASREGVVTREFMRGLERDGPKQFVNMGWLFLLPLVAVVGFRYLAIGAGDQDMYVTAGILASASLMARYFVVRGMR